MEELSAKYKTDVKNQLDSTAKALLYAEKQRSVELLNDTINYMNYLSSISNILALQRRSLTEFTLEEVNQVNDILLDAFEKNMSDVSEEER